MNNRLTYPGAVADSRKREYVPVRRIVFMTEGELRPKNPECLIGNTEIQSYLHFNPPVCVLKPGAALLVDFGIELNGGIRIVADCGPVFRLRVRFGESVSEAMQTPNNDHAMHDTVVDIAPMSHNEIGNTGFRFVRIDVPEELGHEVGIINLSAVAIFRDLPYVGAFDSSDERLNRIWQTGAYTVHLNMQDYIYDGIKRDRLVWMGDLHPEIKTIAAVFDDDELVPASLDFVRDRTPLPLWMNTISSYSLWWIIAQYDWFMARGNLDYLKSNKPYLLTLLMQIAEYIGSDGAEKLPEGRFLDWPSRGDETVIHAGLHAMMIWAFTAGEKLCLYLNENDDARRCADCIRRLRQHCPDAGMSKQGNALKALVGLEDPAAINRRVLSANPFAGLSTFFGYYVMQARALAGDQVGALETIRRYWGGMIDYGATTFWEDFDLAWTVNAGRIDELPVPGKADLHFDFGNHCYKSLRHSLCHGWAGGPTAWLSEHLLGVKALEPGFKTAAIKPCLAGLDWVRGAVPTPYGPIEVTAEKRTDGTTAVAIKKPDEVTLG